MKPQRSFQYRHFVYPVILALFLTVSLSSCIAETQPVDPQGVATTLQAALETQAEQESDFGTLRMYLSGVGTHIAELETEIAKIQLEPPIAQQVSSQGTVVSYLATIVGSIQLTSGPYTTHPRAETPTAYIPAGSVR